jgi:hypothetical protein
MLVTLPPRFINQEEDPIPEWLVICSDESTAKLDKDEFVSDAYSLGIPTTTDIEEISSFLSKDYNGRKIVCSFQFCLTFKKFILNTSDTTDLL